MTQLLYKGHVYREASDDPDVGDPVSSYDYGGQPYLYHWTPEERVDTILRDGLIPGRGENWAEECTKQHCSGRVFLSTDPDKWGTFGWVLLRLPTDEVTCYYDGGEWVDQPEDAYIEGRLSDCYTEVPIPAYLIEEVE